MNASGTALQGKHTVVGVTGFHLQGKRCLGSQCLLWRDFGAQPDRQVLARTEAYTNG
jgi:hypothetical protein